MINIDVDGPASSAANTLGRSVRSGEYIGVGQAQAPLPHTTPTLGGRSINFGGLEKDDDWGVTSNFGVDNVGGCFGNGMGGGIGVGYGVFGGGSKPYTSSTDSAIDVSVSCAVMRCFYLYKMYLCMILDLN